MNRLDRFENSRVVGFKKNMKVYDCDSEEQFSKLIAMTENLDLTGILLIDLNDFSKHEITNDMTLKQNLENIVA